MLEGEKVILEPIGNGDTDDIIRWRNQPFVCDKFINQELFTQESHEKWLETMVHAGKVQQFIIYVKYLDIKIKSIGTVYLRDIDWHNLKAEFGIFIGEQKYLGKGFGSDAAKVILEYASRELKLHKIALRVLASNRGAIECYKKAGFIEEGYFKDEVKLGNKFCDLVFMAAFLTTGNGNG